MTAITPTLTMISNVGESMVWEAKVPVNTIASSADTISISACSAIASGDTIKLISATNVTDGNSILQDIAYTKALRTFAVSRNNVDSAISSDEIRIEFKTIP